MSDITERLAMVFNTNEGKTFTFNLEDPKPDLTTKEVEDNMNAFIDLNLGNKFSLSGIKSANVIVTTKKKLI